MSIRSSCTFRLHCFASVPRSISWIDELPKTGSGKILKRELREPYWKNQTSRVG